MNPAFNSQDLQSLVAPVNEHIFNEKFWNDQTYIINAVDNIQARKYIDNQCTTYGKCLIDSGTLGTKAHVQMVVPHVTSCYNDSQDPPEEGVPLCTMHNFPRKNIINIISKKATKDKAITKYFEFLDLKSLFLK